MTCIGPGGVLSIFEPSRRRDDLTSRCPDVVSQGQLPALQQAPQALSSSLLHTITVQQKREKPLAPYT